MICIVSVVIAVLLYAYAGKPVWKRYVSERLVTLEFIHHLTLHAVFYGAAAGGYLGLKDCGGVLLPMFVAAYTIVFLWAGWTFGNQIHVVARRTKLRAELSDPTGVK